MLKRKKLIIIAVAILAVIVAVGAVIYALGSNGRIQLEKQT